MIQLTRLNNQGLLVNCDLIKFVESAPDTVLTLVSGEKIVVRESSSEVLEKIIKFRRVVMTFESPAAQEPDNSAAGEDKSEAEEESGSVGRGSDRG
jgi:flagellar protein FlbD